MISTFKASFINLAVKLNVCSLNQHTFSNTIIYPRYFYFTAMIETHLTPYCYCWDAMLTIWWWNEMISRYAYQQMNLLIIKTINQIISLPKWKSNFYDVNFTIKVHLFCATGLHYNSDTLYGQYSGMYFQFHTAISSLHFQQHTKSFAIIQS